MKNNESRANARMKTSATDTQLKNALKRLLMEQNQPPEWLEGLFFRITGNTLEISFIHPHFEKWFFAAKRHVFDHLLHNCSPHLKPSYQTATKFNFNKKPPHESMGETGKYKKNKNIQSNHFEDFIFNDKNYIAVTAAKNMAFPENREAGATILLFCGASGTGKTHLLNAIHQSMDNFRLRIVHEKALTLNRSGQDPAFEEAGIFWSRHDALLLDDLQEIIPEYNAQHYLKELIETARKTNSASQNANSFPKKIALSFLGKAGELHAFLPCLRGRLESGIVVEIREADLEVRLKYAEKINREQQMGLTREQLLFLVRQAPRISVLQGILNKIVLIKKNRKRGLTLKELEELTLSDNTETPASWKQIINRVAARFGIKADDVLGTCRKPDHVQARQMAMYICRHKLGFSYNELGKLFGGRDHSTAMHAVARVEKLLETDKDMHILLTQLENSN